MNKQFDRVLAVVSPVVFALAIMFTTTGCESGGGGSIGSGHDFGDNNPDLVLAMGDSITAGGFSGAAPWPSRFSGMAGKPTINDGISGATSGTGSSRIKSLLASRKPGFVIIFYGANDAIQSRGADYSEANIRGIVGACLENKSIPILATVLPITGNRSIYDGNAQEINVRIRKIADDLGVTVVDTRGAMGSDPASLQVDGLHLNDAGEAIVAAEFADLF